jgi:hypothetical protein
LRAAVERWAAQQADKPTLPEAVRRLEYNATQALIPRDADQKNIFGKR